MLLTKVQVSALAQLLTGVRELGNVGGNETRDFVDAGISVAAGVDAPWLFRDLELEPGVGTPMDFVAGAMDGVGHINPNPAEWVMDQRMTAQQALDVLAGNADAVGDSQHRGRLVPGTYADITILSGDITAGTPAEIRRLEVVATIVGGIAEFCRPGDLSLTGNASLTAKL